jgi:hypothetical protein
VGISRIYPSNNGSSSKNKKVLTIDQRQEKIDAMIQKVGRDNDKLDGKNSSLAVW